MGIERNVYFSKILDYLRLCLWYSAATDSEDVSPNDSKHVSKLNEYIRRNYVATEDNSIHQYLMLVKQILFAKRGNTELTCVYDLLNSELECLNEHCVDLMDILASSLKDVSEHTRILVAKSIGILWSIGSSSDVFNTYVSAFLNHYSMRNLVALYRFSHWVPMKTNEKLFMIIDSIQLNR